MPLQPSSPPALWVLLSTYNGARHLAEQVDSIRTQSLADWRLLIRDDGSTDATLQVIERAMGADSRVALWRDDRGNLGPVASFGTLLEAAAQGGARYVALADQDDVWLPDKLERELAMVRAHEGSTTVDHPTLVHSDLAVVDEDLRPIHASFLERQRLEHLAVDPLRRLLIQNFVTGCTTLFNRALLRTVVPVPQVVMHDWWLAQCAAATGTILFIPEPTVLYRQHGANVLGSRSSLQMYLAALRHPAEWWARDGRHLAAARAQACLLAERLARPAHGVTREPARRAIVTGFCQALRAGRAPLAQLRDVRRLGIHPRSLTYPLFFYLRILCGVPTPPPPL
jgi:rhamnosyltransferase